MKRNIFVFEDGKFDVALMINYIENKTCLFALEERRYICREQQDFSEKRKFIISDEIPPEDSYQNNVIVITRAEKINKIYKALKIQFPNATLRIRCNSVKKIRLF